MLNSREWTASYAKSFMAYMKSIFFDTAYQQCTVMSPCPSMKAFYILIHVQGNLDIVGNFFAEQEYNNVFIIRSPNWSSKSQVHVKQVVLERDCQWVEHIWLDADDPIMDGYFNYITSDIPSILNNAGANQYWRGAVFGARYMPSLVLGNDRCGFGIPPLEYFCGQSQGLGLILRRDVWEDIGYPYIGKGDHTSFLKRAREFVMHRLGHEKYLSKSCIKPNVLWKNIENQIQFGIKDALDSQIKFIDVTQRWQTSAIWVLSPFSSHFPWNTLDELPICNSQQQDVIQRTYPVNIKNILELANKTFTTLMENCQSNIFLNGVKNWTRDYPNPCQH